MNKIKDLYEKHKVIIKYLFFGVCTMLVSFSVFYISLWIATKFFGALEYGKDSTRYLVANIVANTLKWCSGVLTAFYTNKKWVFTDADKDVSTPRQLLVFAEGRVLTYIMSLILQYLLEILFAQIITKDITVLGILFTSDIIGTTVALAIYSVIEIIANYYLSKLIVFKTKRN